MTNGDHMRRWTDEELAVFTAGLIKLCRFRHPAAGREGNTFDMVCRRPDRRPPGHSWGRCDEAHCPRFGMAIGPGTVYVGGAKVAEFTGGRAVLAPEPPGRPPLSYDAKDMQF